MNLPRSKTTKSIIPEMPKPELNKKIFFFNNKLITLYKKKKKIMKMVDL